MYYNQYYQPGAQAALSWRSQFMFNPGFRINSGLYYPTSPYSNVYVAQYPSYTPTSCACYTTPCDCESVISQLNQTGRYSRRIDRLNRRIERRNNRIERRIERLTGRLSPTYHADGCHSSSSSDCRTVVVHRHVQVDPETPTSSSSQNQNTPANAPSPDANSFRPNLKSEDAEQLYIRLARKEERQTVGGKEKPFPITKTGANYWCSKGSKNDFTCEIEINLDEGLLATQQSAASGPGAAELPVGNITNEYAGTAVSILRDSPELATIKIRDGKIESAFQKLNGSGKDANSNDQIADLEFFRISKIQNGSGYIYEIELRVKTETGEAIKVSLW
jgi:hypothetical protein